MKYFKKFNKDKKFRNQVLIGILLFVIFSGNLGTESQAVFPAESVCEKVVKDDWGLIYIGSDEEIAQCISAGCVYRDSGLFGLAFEAECKAGLDAYDKIPKDARYVEMYPTIYPLKMCKPGLATAPETQFIDEWVCITEQVAELRDDIPEVCKAWQEPFAKGLKSVWKDAPDDCPTRAYIVMGAAVLLLLAFI